MEKVNLRVITGRRTGQDAALAVTISRRAGLRRLGLSAASAVALAMGFAPSAASANVFNEPVAPDATFAPSVAASGPSDLPPGCSGHWKTPDVRVRTVTRDTYLHEMSAACYPNGPINGAVPLNSTWSRSA